MANTPTLDFELESASGGTRKLRELRGRVVVVFWEDRERQTQNLPLKRELGQLGADLALRRAVSVMGIGDVSAFDFAPARTFVRTTIRIIAPMAGIELLLDWRGLLARPPFSLTVGRSNVLVIDAHGREALRRDGALDEAQRTEVIDAVRALVG